jgi:Flp pilus assembly protein CpaB
MRRSHKFAMLGALALFMSCSAIPPSGSTPEVHIPRGMRAVSMHLDEDVSVAAGDRVDVLLTTTQGQTSTVLELENVEVVAVNQNTRVVTFLASPDDAHKVMAAEGKLRLRLWKSD